MSFRIRLTVLVASAVAVAIVGASVVVYYTDRSQLMSQVDSDLDTTLSLPPLNTGFAAVPPGKRGVQFGSIPAGSRQIVLPGTQKAVQVSVHRRIGAAGPTLNVPTTRRFTTQVIAGQRWRVLTLASGGKTIRISSSLVEVDRNLSHLSFLLVLISLGGIGVAALLGAAVSRTAVAPLRRLTETTERIIDTGDLSERTGQRGRDEVSRLSVRLDELLATLEASLRTQRQLVADASHELRTPIATLRANFEVLADPGALDLNERAELLIDVRDELESMTALVGELVELARGEEFDIEPREFRLDEVVSEAVGRAARRAPELSFRTRLEPSVVTGVPERVERAVANLLDNARKWSPAGATVDVAVHDGLV
jgi:two-component system, OmpR family, sensor histidine kinase MprB